MASKFLLFALATTAGWSCSPVANPIIEGPGSLRADAAGGSGGTGSDDSGAEIADGDATTEHAPPSQICGNGEREGDESCDDAQNPTPGFGCKNDCASIEPAVCGDGVVTSPEVCDGPSVYCDK